MLDLKHPPCRHCGKPVDIVIDPKTGRRTVSRCTNEDCPSNQVNPLRSR